MSNIEKLIRELRLDISKDSEESLKKVETRITKTINEHTDRKIGAIHEEIEKIKRKDCERDKRLLELEKQIRSRNIVFFGVKESEYSYEELEAKIISTIEKYMKIKCHQYEIESVRRMGRRAENKIRPIVATFTTMGKKILILKNKHYLKEHGIYLKEDYPKQVLEMRRSLKDQLIKEKKEGKIAYIKYDKLIVKSPNTPVDKNLSKPFSQKKKRILELTPPNTENPNIRPDQKGNSSQEQAAKKTKVRENNYQKVQYPIQKFFQNNKEIHPEKYVSARSSEGSSEE